MLLINNAEGEGVELSVVGEQGVGADDEVDFAGGDLGLEGGFVFGGASEQGEAGSGGIGGGMDGGLSGRLRIAEAQRGEELREAFVVLSGKDGGGGEQSGLVTIKRGLGGSEGGHDGFTRADIALEQAVHRQVAV